MYISGEDPKKNPGRRVEICIDNFKFVWPPLYLDSVALWPDIFCLHEHFRKETMTPSFFGFCSIVARYRLFPRTLLEREDQVWQEAVVMKACVTTTWNRKQQLHHYQQQHQQPPQ